MEHLLANIVESAAAFHGAQSTWAAEPVPIGSVLSVTGAARRKPQPWPAGSASPSWPMKSTADKQLGINLPLYHAHGVASEAFIKLAAAAAEGVRLPAAAEGVRLPAAAE